ncbi:MAG: RecB family exonuclease [Acidimicrobiales bacterium]
MPERKPLEGLVVWGGRRQTRLVLSPEAVKKVARKTLSPSTAQAMRGCSARWVIDKLLPSTKDPFGAPELGTAAHRAFELLFERPPHERTSTVGMEIVTSLHLDSSIAAPDDNSVDQWRDEVVRRVMGLWGMEDPREIDVVGLEVPIRDVAVGGVPFGGVADRITRRDGKIVVGDYKAGLSKPKQPSTRFGDPHGDQLRLYVTAITNMDRYSDPISVAELLYTAHRQRRSVDIAPEAVTKTVEDFKISYDALNTQVELAQFRTKTSALCGWCPAVSVCPAAQAKGLTERAVFDIAGEALGIEVNNPSDNFPTPPSKVVPDLKEKEQKMSKDTVPYEETLRDGTLNPGSYAATAVFGTVELALKELHYADVPINGRSVTALAHTFASIVGTVYEEIDDSDPSFQHGLHKNLRGALYTSLVTLPVPFGCDADAWEAWVTKTTQRVRAIAKAAFALWETEDLGDEPWAPLVEASHLSVVGDPDAA